MPPSHKPVRFKSALRVQFTSILEGGGRVGVHANYSSRNDDGKYFEEIEDLVCLEMIWRGLDAEFKSRDFLMMSSAPINWCVRNFLNILHPLDLVDFGWQLTFSKEDFEMSCLVRSSRVIWTLQARTQTFDRQVMKLKVLSLSVKPRGFCEECKRIRSTRSDPDIISVALRCFSDCLLTCLLAQWICRGFAIKVSRICSLDFHLLSSMSTGRRPLQLWDVAKNIKEMDIFVWSIIWILFVTLCSVLSVDWHLISLLLRRTKEYSSHYVPPPVLSQLCCFSDVASSQLWAVFLREGW